MTAFAITQKGEPMAMAEIKVPIQVNLPDDWVEQIIERLRNDPDAEWVEVTRCKDCKYYEIAWLKKDGTDNRRYKPSICVKGQYGIVRKPDWFCADAERREE